MTGRRPSGERRRVVVPAAPSKREVLAAFGTALGFPDYYGANLDALNDCLQDLASELANGEGRPLEIEWRVSQAFRATPAFAAVEGILADAVGASEDALTVRVVDA
ncbi:Barstar family protein [Sinomonas atrocyanea]|uniref:Barstar family protein n=1 Tax=Sinomonas atrocyanea TaxID=37927 RepID=A0A126ZWY8_9MICC|nr:barstar family protein [Sinomonas atrocyanea]AMM31477.1 Barstar family protein [Sinomonas atrocyanea]GEB63762.1 hypothetical protein SAT01_12100 [Sinomonas atrocyanea]GGG64225.1 hypothetical protein GCM10007172_14480 [Sinomonas atrocyanea]